MDQTLRYLFPYLLLPLATVLTCISLVFLVARSAESRKEFRLLAVAAIAVMLWSIFDICSYVIAIPGILRVLSSAASCIYLIIPVMVQLPMAHRGACAHRPTLMAGYVLASAATVASWTGQVPHVELFGSALSLVAAGCIIVCSRTDSRGPGEKTPRLAETVLVSGSVLLLVLLCLQPLLKALFPPLSLSFVPVIMITWALRELAGKDERGVPGKQTLIQSFVIALVMVPFFCDLIFLATNARSLFSEQHPARVFHHAVVIAAGLLVAGVCAFMSARKADKKTKSLLFTVICLFACVAGLRDLIVMSLPGGLTAQIILVSDLFLVNIIGVSSHLVLRMTRKDRGWMIPMAYALGPFLIPVMLYESLPGRGLFANAFLQYRGLGHLLFTIAFGVMLLLCGVLLARDAMNDSDPIRKRGSVAVLIGMGITFLTLAASVAVPSSPLYDLAFIALLPVGYGVFARDLRRVSAYTRKQTTSGLLRLLLTIIYLSLAFFIAWIFRDSPVQSILDRLVPYGIPPLLSFLFAAGLSLFVLGMEKNRPEGQLFSLISFCYAVLNLDIALLTVVQDPYIALFISRVDHFFLVLLLLGVNLHLAYLVTGKKDAWWVVYASYLIGAVMAPLTQTEWYFQGVSRYYFGFFAHKAILYDVMSVLWGLALAYTVHLLHQASKSAERGRRETIRRVITAFIILAVMSLGNTPAIYGYEVYPLGTFIFPALFYLAYGLFRFNLRAALQDIRALLFGIGLAAVTVAIGFLPVCLLKGIGMNARILAGLILVSVLYHPVKNGWNAVLDLFIRKSSDVMKKSFYTLTDSLSRLHHREKIHQMLSSWFFEVLEGSSFVSLFSVNDLSGQRIFFGWKAWNDRIETGLFGDRERPVRENDPLNLRKDHPLIDICRREQAICTKDALLKLSPSLHAFDGNDGLLRDAEIVMPVFSKGEMVAVMLIGKKADGAPYSPREFDVIHNVSLVLGPQIENAVLMEDLEKKVIKRTRELNIALSESLEKERAIRENSEIITRQNQIFRTLLETSTRIHQLESLDDLFSFILRQLHTLFSDFQGGIILENKRRGILEATSFIGISEEEQRVILGLRSGILAPDFGETLNGAFVREGISTSAGDAWTVIPMEARSSKISGYMILKGQDIDRQTREIFTVFLGQLSAVTQNKLLMIQLERMASTDGMTNLYNRAFLNQELRKAIQHAMRFKNIFFSIMVVDVNGLKKLNDTYGHEKGDEAIIKVAHLLKAQCRTTDIVCRLGGDEFAILMPSTNRTQADILFSRIVEGAETLKVVVPTDTGQQATLPVHISVGLASSDDTPPEDVMKKADTNMYEAKEKFYADKGARRG